MTAERLRRAAAKLREVAEGATGGRWYADDCYATITAEPFKSACEAYDRRRADDGGRCERDPFVIPEADGGGAHFGNLEYIATLSPPVALAMADLLDRESWRLLEFGRRSVNTGEVLEGLIRDEFEEALAVADAVLGEAS